MTTCELCPKPTRDDAYACDDCIQTAFVALGDIPWLNAELDTTIAKQRAATSGGGAPSAEKALPLHMPAVEKRDRLRAELVAAVRFCTEEGVRHSSPNDDLPSDDLPAISRWLMWRCDGLALNDMGPQILAGIVEAARACQRVIDNPPERAYAGPCHECKRDLYHQPKAVQVKCSGCGSTWDRAELMEWMREQVEDQLVSTREAATLLCRFGIETQQDTVKKWGQRNLLIPHATDAHGRSRYRFGDVLDVATRRAGA